jgi:DNA-directed RNA polymerase subunit RPC12/RpoP
MKRIIKHGNPQEVKYYFVCTSCGCEFEMTNKDLQEEQQSIVFTVLSNCPECNNKVIGKQEFLE